MWMALSIGKEYHPYSSSFFLSFFLVFLSLFRLYCRNPHVALHDIQVIGSVLTATERSRSPGLVPQVPPWKHHCMGAASFWLLRVCWLGPNCCVATRVLAKVGHAVEHSFAVPCGQIGGHMSPFSSPIFCR